MKKRILLLAVLLLLTLLITVETPSIELIVVFKKEIDLTKANEILHQFKFPYRQGMSSRGKHYFYKTGPKFIVTLPVNKNAAFLENCKNIPEIFEVFEPDWEILKD